MANFFIPHGKFLPRNDANTISRMELFKTVGRVRKMNNLNNDMRGPCEAALNSYFSGN